MASGGKQKPVWEKLLESARRAATKISPKNRSPEKANHPWLSFGVTRGNSQSPKQPAPPASVVVPSAPSLQEAAASLVPSGHKTSLIQAEIVDLEVGRRIEQEREDELQATRWENATLLCFDPSVLPAEITGNRHFYNTYADLPLERVPRSEIVHEIIFLRYLNKQTELAYETIELSVEAALEEFKGNFATPREFFHFLGLTTFFTPPESISFPSPSPVLLDNLTQEGIPTVEEGTPSPTQSEQADQGDSEGQNITPPEENESHPQPDTEKHETPKVPLEHSSVPKRVSFTPEVDVMDNQTCRPWEQDDQESRLFQFNTIYQTLIRQNISPELATLAASRALETGQQNGPRFTSTPHAQINSCWQQNAPSVTASSQTIPIDRNTEAKVDQSTAAVQTDLRVGENNTTSYRKLSDVDKQGAQLLSQIHVFKNKGDGMDFEAWVRHFENTLDIGDFEDSRKIKYLVSKLMGPAGDFVEQYRLDHPVEASCYNTLKRALKERFMGKNIEYKYQTSYDNCRREPGESIRSFACRVQKLLRRGYPALSNGKNQETIEQFSRHKFLDGLSADLQDRLLCLEFTSFDQLIEAAERHDTAIEQREARQKRELVNAINMLPKTRSPTPTRTDNSILESLRKLNDKLDKTAEKQEELRKDLQEMQKKSTPRNVTFEGDQQKFCALHKYGTHTTNECLVLRSQNSVHCFKCGNPGHKSFECTGGSRPQQGPQSQNWRQKSSQHPAQATTGIHSASEEALNG
jgi:hypothetical protein